MRTVSLLAAFVAVLASGCGGGGGDTPAPTAGSPAPSQSPPPAPPPAPAPTTAPGTWTAPLGTCVNPIGTAEMTGISLGHMPCLAGSYYAVLINENFSNTGARIGKTCSVTIGLDGTFTLYVDGAVETVYRKTVSTVINGVEQSNSFAYSYFSAGSTPAITALELWNGGAVVVAVDPSRIAFTPFFLSTSKVRITANYLPAGASSNRYLVCEG